MARIELDYNHLPAVIRTIANEDDRMSKSVAEFMRDLAAANAPVRTGRLISRIRVEKTGAAEHTVISDTGGEGFREYAAYNEYGTRYMRAQPYMMPAYVEGVRFVTLEAVSLGERITLAAETGRVV